MKLIASLAALIAVLVLAAPVSAALSSDSISLDQAQPVAPGSQVTFTVTGSKGVFIENVCLLTNNTESSETKPVGSAFTVPTDATVCSAFLLDKHGNRLRGQGGYFVAVHYCVAQPGWICFSD